MFTKKVLSARTVKSFDKEATARSSRHRNMSETSKTDPSLSLYTTDDYVTFESIGHL